MEEQMIRRGSTPSLQLRVKGTDLSGFDVYVTLSHRSHVMRRGPTEIAISYDEDVGDTLVDVPLSQEDTLSWPEGAHVECQAHAIAGSTRIETDIGVIKVGRTLRSEVLP